MALLNQTEAESLESSVADAPPSKLDQLVARRLAMGAECTPARRESLRRAIEAGASDAVLGQLADAPRLSRKFTIVLPAHRFENLSRGKGWCRLGKGDSAAWGERVDNGYQVGPGRWTVGASDGFSRKGQDTYTVKHVTVGTETWTVAS